MPNELQNNKEHAPPPHETTTVLQTSFSGPLPHPSILASYEQVHKGAADRIIRMAEEQSVHRQRLEDHLMRSRTMNESWGMLFSFIITMGLMAVGALLLLSGRSVAGFLAFFSPAVFHAGNYLYHQRRKQEQ